MSRVFSPKKVSLPQAKRSAIKKTTPINNKSRNKSNSNNNSTSSASTGNVDFDDFTTSSSIIEFLAKEQECNSDADAESIFQEVSRLTDNTDTRSVDEILREAELLIQQQQLFGVGGGVGGNGGTTETLTNKRRNQNFKQNIKLNSIYTKSIENLSATSPAAKVITNGFHTAPRRSKTSDKIATTPTPQTPTSSAATPLANGGGSSHFTSFVDNLPSESVISQESTPKDMKNFTSTERDMSTAQLDHDDDTDDGTDTMEEITEGIETIELMVHEGSNALDLQHAKNFEANTTTVTEKAQTTTTTIAASVASVDERSIASSSSTSSFTYNVSTRTRNESVNERRQSCENALSQLHNTAHSTHVRSKSQSHSRPPLNFNATQACSPSNMLCTRRASMTTPDSGISNTHSSQYTPRPYSPPKSNTNAITANAESIKTYCDKSVNSSPKHFTSTLTSPIEPTLTVTREHALKHEIDQLQERLKDTEERLKSLRIQHDSLSQVHRDLRESHTRLQEDSELLKLDVQHLNECANVLRAELQAARADRDEALELQKVLQAELEEARQEKKQTLEQKDKDSKVIQDLQRQCREMERILMRKHPDSVSALIVAAKNPGKRMNNEQDNPNSRKLLEQRIAQLESDAKEQDLKAQQILANVQARFNSVQTKYETHIADLETQVLSLQEINTKLNEKIESQVRTLDYFVAKKADKYYNNCTQTDAIQIEEPNVSRPNSGCLSSMATQTAMTAAAMRDHSTNTIGSATSSASSTANSTPNTSRPNSKQSGLRKPSTAVSGLPMSKLPVSQSDSTISQSAYHAAAKEDAHLLATIRGMRVDLAIKDKAMTRLTRELDECKKTIRKLQKEKEVLRNDKPHSGSSSASGSRRSCETLHTIDHHTTTPATTESHSLKEAQNKIKLLEADYKTLHDKRMQDLKILQTAHERELASCHETVRILQQRLNEREESSNSVQKRRKVPADYYALKDKVSDLERRHVEREERLHMLVQALSKGRLNGALEDIMTENNNQ